MFATHDLSSQQLPIYHSREITAESSNAARAGSATQLEHAPTSLSPVNTASLTQRAIYFGSQLGTRSGFQFLNAVTNFTVQLVVLRYITRNLNIVGTAGSVSTAAMKAAVANALECFGPKLKFNSKTELIHQIVDGVLDGGCFILGAYLVANGRELRKTYAHDVEGIQNPNAEFTNLLLDDASALLAFCATVAAADFLHYAMMAGVKAAAPSAKYENKPLPDKLKKAGNHLATLYRGIKTDEGAKTASEFFVRLLTAAGTNGWPPLINQFTKGINYAIASPLTALLGGALRVPQPFEKDAANKALIKYRDRRLTLPTETRTTSTAALLRQSTDQLDPENLEMTPMGPGGSSQAVEPYTYDPLAIQAEIEACTTNATSRLAVINNELAATEENLSGPFKGKGISQQSSDIATINADYNAVKLLRDQQNTLYLNAVKLSIESINQSITEADKNRESGTQKFIRKVSINAARQAENGLNQMSTKFEELTGKVMAVAEHARSLGNRAVADVRNLNEAQDQAGRPAEEINQLRATADASVNAFHESRAWYDESTAIHTEVERQLQQAISTFGLTCGKAAHLFGSPGGQEGPDKKKD